MRELDEYLERRGAKYFVTLTVFCYVIGTVVFNIYLNSINIAEFNLLKLRYMFVGIMFCLITSIFPLLYFVFKKILGKKNLVEPTEEQVKKRKSILEVIIIALFIPWTVFYSIKIFPEIPAGFGGAKPEIVRLVGNPETIKELNELIAFETGVDVETLPFQFATEKSTLAIGANVKILDRNNDRYVLILTKDLYLSSTSNVAKQLLESGEIKSFESSVSEDFFQAKPIYFSSENIRGTTTTLFEPSKITTAGDLKIAAQVVADNPDKARAIETVIARDLPDSASRIIAAVEKKAQETKDENKVNSGSDTVDEDEIQEILNDAIDPKFLAFRAKGFNDSGSLYEKERTGIILPNGKKDLVQFITTTFQSDFPAEWNLFSGNENYLIAGQGLDDFTKSIQNIFRGADSAKIVMERLNALEVPKIDDFTPVIAAAKVLFESSSQEDSEYNRKFISEVLSRHFNQKARKYTAYWSDPKYIYSGVHDENYFENIRNFFKTVDSWDSVKTVLTSYQKTLETPTPVDDIVPVEEPISENTNEATTEEESTDNSDSTPVDDGTTTPTGE